MTDTAAQGLLDTNTVILLPRLDDPSMLPAEPLISTITHLTAEEQWGVDLALSTVFDSN